MENLNCLRARLSFLFLLFTGPFLRDLKSRGTYSPATISALEHPKCEELNPNLVAALIFQLHVEKERDGAILVFLPGWEDISKVNALLTSEGKSRFFLHNADIFPLHSLLPTANQRQVFLRPTRPNVRKIVLATNIAETSITIGQVCHQRF